MFLSARALRACSAARVLEGALLHFKPRDARGKDGARLDRVWLPIECLGGGEEEGLGWKIEQALACS